MFTPLRPLYSSFCGVVLLLAGTAVNAADVGAEARAILTANCLKCHGPAKQKGGLRLDSRDAAVSKADSGAPAVVPHKPDASELIRRVTAADAKTRMPPGDTPLTAGQIDTLRKWIDAGAAWPREGPAPANTGKTELVVTDEDRKHWAFRPLGPVALPADAKLTRTPVDRFILAALTAKGLTPAAPAPREQLIRRVTFDLTGLPPTPAEVAAFVTAPDADAAYEALVDRLLASPRYGERWGRHWLDVARYADSGGYEGDIDRPAAFHYRDFVIRALNDDMPFDAFVRRQLAGDGLEPDDPRAIAATGFLTAGPSPELPDKLLEEERQRQRYIDLDDMVSTTGSALLGLSVGCARCHDHKFDPISARDYYRVLAALHSGDRAEVPLGTRAEVEAHKRAKGEWEKQRKAVEAKLDALRDARKKFRGPNLLEEEPDGPPVGHDNPALRQWNDLTVELIAVKAREPKAPPAALAFRDFGAKPAVSWLFGRGDFHDRATPVELGFLTVLTRDKPAADYWKEARADGDRTDTTYQRKALATWITDADRGAGALLARVIVNRVWQHHFGEGLVRTPNDFGARGERPTHSELLEWLATDLVAHGWKLKHLHRTILLSAVYRQSSQFRISDCGLRIQIPLQALTAVMGMPVFIPQSAIRNPKLEDPDNRLLWRVRPRRLEAEALRDAMLAVGGSLNEEMYGPAFKAPIPADAMVARNLKNPYPQNIPDGPPVRRRSVYMFHKRVIPHPLLQAFDVPDAQQCAGRRNVTTVAPQALALLNDPFVRARATDFADRLLRDADGDPARSVDRAYRLAFGRPPIDAERNAGVEFLAAQSRERSARDPKAGPPEIRRQALTDYCQALFGLNEFIYVD